MTELDHKLRATGIGGSEAAAALGLSNSVTALDLYRHKVYGEELPINASDMQLWLGHQLEPVVAAAFTKHTGMELQNPHQNFFHPDYPFIRGYIDRKVEGKSEGVELKAWSEFSRFLWGPDGSDDVPMTVLCQCVHYLVATGWDCWHVGVLLGTEFRYYTIHRDDAVIKMLIDGEKKFWNHVETETPPPAQNLKDVHYLYRSARPGSEREATADELSLHRKLYIAKARKKKIEHEISTLEFQLKQNLKDCAKLVHPDDPDYTLLTWNDRSRKTANTTALKKHGLWDAYSQDVTNRAMILKEPIGEST